MGTPRFGAITALAALAAALWPAPVTAVAPRPPAPADDSARDSRRLWPSAGDPGDLREPGLPSARDPRHPGLPSVRDPRRPGLPSARKSGRPGPPSVRDPRRPRPPAGEARDSGRSAGDLAVPPPPPVRNAILRVTDVLTPDPLIAGARAVYALTVANTGDRDADDVLVTGLLDENLALGLLPADCSATGHTVVCGGSGLTIAPGRDITYELPVTTSPALPDGTNLTNRAYVTSPNATADEAQLIIRARSVADVEIVKHAPATAPTGGTVAYRLTVVNHGPSQAVDVTVQDHLGGDGATLPAECSAAGPALTCPLGVLDPDERRTFGYTVVPGVAGLMEGCATVHTGGRERNTADNRSCAGTTVMGDPPSSDPALGTGETTDEVAEEAADETAGGTGDGAARSREHDARGHHEKAGQAGAENGDGQDEPKSLAAGGEVPAPAHHRTQSLPLTGASLWMLGLGVAVLLAIGLLVRSFSRRDPRPGRTR
ncbi:hypothetical protein AB0M50_47885 [Nonomuraea fuscirosea]|uniref:hypothetical protein n=1 Tax=Nonomuraea fuscirosea TaxID=1291556 RepID=UPI00342FABB7